jgi:hypothetical protein
MKSFLFVAACLIFMNHAAHAQLKTRELKQTLELKMPKTAEDDMPGKRGASVVWHPIQKKYYASFAGNVGFPIAVFDIKGKRLSSDEQTAMADVRGLWYNATTKRIEGNGYDEFGWFHYTLDAKGMINELEVDFEGLHQPDGQSVGTYNPVAKQVLFLSSAGVNIYDLEGENTDNTIALHWGRTKSQGIDREALETEIPEGYNTSSLIFTGIAGAEIGILNVTENQVELYNKANGFLTQKLKMPADIPVETFFNFAYANGMFWFFDMEKRIWTGCK